MIKDIYHNSIIVVVPEILVMYRNNIVKIGSPYAFLFPLEPETTKNEWRSPFRRGRGDMML